MRSLLGFSLLAAVLALPAFAQYQPNRLPPQDQKQFDNYYQKWTNDTRRNDRDDIRKDEQRMQEIMRRDGIPPDMPYDRIASGGQYYDRDRDDRDHDRDRGAYGNGYADWRGRMSPGDQQQFDNVYSKWLQDQRKDRDDIPKDERKMRDIMGRYNIPPDVPFGEIASQGGRY